MSSLEDAVSGRDALAASLGIQSDGRVAPGVQETMLDSGYTLHNPDALMGGVRADRRPAEHFDESGTTPDLDFQRFMAVCDTLIVPTPGKDAAENQVAPTISPHAVTLFADGDATLQGDVMKNPHMGAPAGLPNTVSYIGIPEVILLCGQPASWSFLWAPSQWERMDPSVTWCKYILAEAVIACRYRFRQTMTGFKAGSRDVLSQMTSNLDREVTWLTLAQLSRWVGL